MTVTASPLSWPAGWPRVPAAQRVRARFSRENSASDGAWRRRDLVTVADAVRRVRSELGRMAIADRDVIVSTDLSLRLDGLPRSGQREPADPGAAVYWRGAYSPNCPQMCMAIDRYTRVADNVAAIAATLAAMRAIERHGGGAILERAFVGFAALPAPDSSAWWEVLGVDPDINATALRAQYRVLRSKYHPDKPGGDRDRFEAVQRAYHAALEFVH